MRALPYKVEKAMVHDDKSTAGYVRSLVSAFINTGHGHFIIVL